MSVPEEHPIPDYLWPDPHNPGWWVDAWNGSYDNLTLALEDTANAGASNQPRILRRGEGIISEDKAEYRRQREADHERTNRMLQQLATKPTSVTDLEVKALSRTAETTLKEMTSEWTRTMRAIARAAEAVEHAANRWEEKAGEV